MTRQQEKIPTRRALLCVVGVCFLAALALPPPRTYPEGQSLFHVALASPWTLRGDWVAAWCSLKIIVLSINLFGLIVFLTILFVLSEHVNLARVTLLSTLAPGVGLLFGLYCLLKALF